MAEESILNVRPLSLSIVKRKENLKVKAREVAGTIVNLRTQAKELEQQRDFLITWKANIHNGVDAKNTHVDVEFQGLDGDRVHAHKAILVCFLPIDTIVYNIIQFGFKIFSFLKFLHFKIIVIVLYFSTFDSSNFQNFDII